VRLGQEHHRVGQRRGAVHFHAVLRLDAATECRCPGCLAPPPEPFTADLLEAALRETVAAVRVPCPPFGSDPAEPVRFARWGAQLDVRNITTGDGQAGELSAEQVAGYVAKYATKATETFGTGLDHRLREGDLAGLELPAHVAELVHACWELGARPSPGWAAVAGVGAHARVPGPLVDQEPPLLDHHDRSAPRPGRLRQARRAAGGIPLDAWGRAEDDDQAAVVIATWSYVGCGYQTQGEVWLALSAAARARERRRIASEELTTTTLTAAA
jgi:hypothetical protein